MKKAIKIVFCGEELVLDASGVIFWPAQNLLIVADLHFEKGKAFARQGNLIPPLDTTITLDKLQVAIANYQPQIILSLGDSFHDIRTFGFIDPAIQDQLGNLSQKFHWIWISGNHDPFLPENIKGEIVAQKHIEGLLFRHEPSQDSKPGEISGHLHPAKRIKRYGTSLRFFCFATDFSRLIMPAFGAYTGGLELGHKAFDGLFDQKQLVAFMLNQGQIFPTKF